MAILFSVRSDGSRRRLVDRLMRRRTAHLNGFSVGETACDSVQGPRHRVQNLSHRHIIDGRPFLIDCDFLSRFQTTPAVHLRESLPGRFSAKFLPFRAASRRGFVAPLGQSSAVAFSGGTRCTRPALNHRVGEIQGIFKTSSHRALACLETTIYSRSYRENTEVERKIEDISCATSSEELSYDTSFANGVHQCTE
jgi:hypothetical protein